MKRNKWKCFAVLLAALLAVGSFAGCGKVTGNSELESSSSQQEDSSDEVKPQGNINPLTGLDDLADEAVGKRPAAIMINNIKIALPQSGIDSADVVYEMVVEGGITRLMAVFADYHKVPTTGSIRSARHNYLELALPLDAVYVHFGGSNIAKEKIKAYGITDDIDGLYSQKPFMQDKAIAAAKGREHSYYTTGELLDKTITDRNIRTESKGTSNIFNFSDAYTPAADAADCSAIQIKYSGYITANFTYDAKTDSYKKRQFGEDHVDANTGEAASVHNVFVLFTNVYTMDKQGHQQVDLKSGSGYYCTGGKYQKITWSKDGVNAPIVYKDASGNELLVSPGTSWVCITSDKNMDSTVITP